MSDQITHIDARIQAMQQEYAGQIGGLAARCALLASELAAVKADLAEAQKPDQTESSWRRCRVMPVS